MNLWRSYPKLSKGDKLRWILVRQIEIKRIIPMETETFILIGTLDTKGEEFLYVKKLIEKEKHRVITIDMGTGARGEAGFSP